MRLKQKEFIKKIYTPSLRSLAYVLKKLNININYPGLRFETIEKKINFQYHIFSSLVCMGDSNTFGWNYEYERSYPSLLEKEMAPYFNLKVINSGKARDKICDAHKRLSEDLLFYKPETAVLNFGLNDGRLIRIKRNKNHFKMSDIYEINGFYYTTALSLKDFEEQFDSLIEKIRLKFTEIFVIGLYEIKKMKSGPYYTDDKKIIKTQNEIYFKMENIIKKTCIKHNVRHFDLWNNLNKYEKIKNCLQKDGFHLNTESYGLIIKLLKESILKIYKNI